MENTDVKIEETPTPAHEFTIPQLPSVSKDVKAIVKGKNRN